MTLTATQGTSPGIDPINADRVVRDYIASKLGVTDIDVSGGTQGRNIHRWNVVFQYTTQVGGQKTNVHGRIDHFPAEAQPPAAGTYKVVYFNPDKKLYEGPDSSAALRAI